MPHASDAKETAATGRVGSAASGTGSGVRRQLRSQMSTGGSNATNSNTTADNNGSGMRILGFQRSEIKMFGAF